MQLFKALILAPLLLVISCATHVNEIQSDVLTHSIEVFKTAYKQNYIPAPGKFMLVYGDKKAHVGSFVEIATTDYIGLSGGVEEALERNGFTRVFRQEEADYIVSLIFDTNILESEQGYEMTPSYTSRLKSPSTYQQTITSSTGLSDSYQIHNFGGTESVVSNVQIKKKIQHSVSMVAKIIFQEKDENYDANLRHTVFKASAVFRDKNSKPVSQNWPTGWALASSLAAAIEQPNISGDASHPSLILINENKSEARQKSDEYINSGTAEVFVMTPDDDSRIQYRYDRTLIYPWNTRTPKTYDQLANKRMVSLHLRGQEHDSYLFEFNCMPLSDNKSVAWALINNLSKPDVEYEQNIELFYVKNHRDEKIELLNNNALSFFSGPIPQVFNGQFFSSALFTESDEVSKKNWQDMIALFSSSDSGEIKFYNPSNKVSFSLLRNGFSESFKHVMKKCPQALELLNAGINL